MELAVKIISTLIVLGVIWLICYLLFKLLGKWNDFNKGVTLGMIVANAGFLIQSY